METLDAALTEVDNIPAYLPNCLQLKDVVAKAKKWLQEAEALQVKHRIVVDTESSTSISESRCELINLVPVCLQLGGRIPVLESLSELVLRAEGIPVKLDPLSRLEALVSDVETWKESAGKTFLLKNSPFSLLEVSPLQKCSFPKLLSQMCQDQK